MIPSGTRVALLASTMTDAIIQARIDSRIADFARDVCERVRMGEVTDLEANELSAEFADRMYREGPWS
jgi:hypothetical protein